MKENKDKRFSRSFLNINAWKKADLKERYRLFVKMTTWILASLSIIFMVVSVVVWIQLSNENEARFLLYWWPLGEKTIMIPDADNISAGGIIPLVPKVVKDGQAVVMGLSLLAGGAIFLLALLIHNKGLTKIGATTAILLGLAVSIGFGGIVGMILGLASIGIGITYWILFFNETINKEISMHFELGFYKYFGETKFSGRGA